jgi:hypothetical protein
VCQCRERLVANGLFWRCAEEFWVEVVALLLMWLVLFDLDPVGVRVGVLPDASHLPGNLHIRLAGANDKAILLHLLGYDGLGELAVREAMFANEAG